MNEHYEAVLTDLKRIKSDAEAGIAAIERLIAKRGFKNQGAPQIIQSTQSSQLDSKQPASDQDSLAFRLLKLFNSDPDCVYNAEDLAGEYLGTENVKTVRGTLARLAKDGKIIRSKRGLYKGLPQAQNPDG